MMNMFSVIVTIFARVVVGLRRSTTNTGINNRMGKNLARYRVKIGLIHFFSEKSVIKPTPRIPARTTTIISGLI
jgi:hypothetical protein